MNKQRIIVIDEHIVGQWRDAVGKWWTASKANNNDEKDFAVWELSELNLTKASRLLPHATTLRSTLKPVQRRDRWFAYASDSTSKNTYGEALRAIARGIA